MKISKAVITAAGPGQQALPVQTLVDRDGETRSVLGVLVGEARRAGVEDVAVVVHPGDEAAYRAARPRPGCASSRRTRRAATAMFSGAPATSSAATRSCTWSAMQKVRDSGRAALIAWATGAASDYVDNVPSQCLHPVGHWYEVPNMLRNGVLKTLLEQRLQLQYLMVHNIDTLGADADPALLGRHIASGAAMTVEVIPRRLEDRGGGLARVDGRLRLVEGLAMAREEDEFALSYCNSLTTWVTVDALLAAFGLSRADLADDAKVTAGVRRLAARMPTYVTLKDVKRHWGQGQEDVFPVTQFEKLWGDMTALPEWDSRFVAIPRRRGQQMIYRIPPAPLADAAQPDGLTRRCTGRPLRVRLVLTCFRVPCSTRQ